MAHNWLFLRSLSPGVNTQMHLQTPTQNWASIFQLPGHWDPGATSRVFKEILIMSLKSRQMPEIPVSQGFWLMECVLIAMNLI